MNANASKTLIEENREAKVLGSGSGLEHRYSLKLEKWPLVHLTTRRNQSDTVFKLKLNAVLAATDLFRTSQEQPYPALLLFHQQTYLSFPTEANSVKVQRASIVA